LILLPLLVAVSIAVSRCRFWLPFGRAKSFTDIIFGTNSGIQKFMKIFYATLCFSCTVCVSAVILHLLHFPLFSQEMKLKLSIKAAGYWISACICPVFAGIGYI